MKTKARNAFYLLVCLGLAAGCSSVVPVQQGVGGPDTSGDTIEYETTESVYSVESRAIRSHFIGNAGPGVLIIGGIHGSEPEGLEPTHRVVEYLNEQKWPARIVVVEDLNPDGSMVLSRYNSRGVDLNRNWPADSFVASRRHGDEPLSETETEYGYTLIQRLDPDLVIVLHSIHTGPFVNYDGPAAKLARVFAEAADAADPGHSWGLQPQMGYPTPGSIGTYVGVDLGVPILTIEFDRGHDERDATRALLAGVEAVLGVVVESE